MFTGIVEELGTVAAQDASRLRIAARTVLDGVQLGDSTAVNGCCLTVVAFERPADDAPGWWEADVSDESYRRTNLGDLQVGDPVNLERPVRLTDRLGSSTVESLWRPDGLEHWRNGSVTPSSASRPHAGRRSRSCRG